MEDNPTVTQEMISAGYSVLMAYEPGFDDPASLLAEIYEAMEAMRPLGSSKNREQHGSLLE